MQKHQDFALMTRDERVMALNNTADSVMDEYTYSRPLSDKEIANKNSDLNQALQRIRDLEDERKALNERMKDEKNIIQNNNKEILRGTVQKTERIWQVIDSERGTLDRVNADGFIIDTIRISSSGTNVSLFNKSNTNERTGTHDDQ